jgi:hypothetical protein
MGSVMPIPNLFLPIIAADMGGITPILVDHGHPEDVGVDGYQAINLFRGRRIPVAPEPTPAHGLTNLMAPAAMKLTPRRNCVNDFIRIDFPCYLIIYQT